MEETYRTSVCLRALADSARGPRCKSIAERLRGLRDENLADIQVIVSGAVEDAANNKQEMTQKFLIRYYNEHLQFGFGTREKQGCRLLHIFARTRSAAKASARVSLV